VSDSASYTSAEVCAITGLNFRQLDYAIRRLPISPRDLAVGSGRSRRFTAEEVRVLGVVRRLRDVGASDIVCEKAIALIHEPEGLRWLVVVDGEPVLGAEGEVERLAAGRGSIVCDLAGVEART
jgi:hypothetical protein